MRIENSFPEACHWIEKQNLDPGNYEGYLLPERFSALSANGRVNIVKEETGRLILLTKVRIGMKHNYSGFVYATLPISKHEMTKDYYGRNEIDIPGLDFNNPVIKRKINPNFFEVYFDLG